MAHKTFISYKYSESTNLRDKIIRALGDDATYYKGETSKSPNISDQTTERIKANLKDMIYDSSVTVVIVSPNMNKSEWIDWEISYSLKAISRGGRCSNTNGIVAVVQQDNSGSYEWVYNPRMIYGYNNTRQLNSQKISPLIVNNQNNINGIFVGYGHDTSYVEVVNDYIFLSNPNHYIDKAHARMKNYNLYNIKKEI